MMTQREKQALRNFAAGYNCAQSVFMAYGDLAGLTREQSAQVAAGFGGGMGRLRLECGAFSAAVMLCGILTEHGDDPSARPDVYTRVQQVHQQFVEKCGSASCAELLDRYPKKEGPTPEERTPAYYASRPCSKVILQACHIIEEQLAASYKSTGLKALILSTHTGGGHDAAAFALEEALTAKGVSCRVMDCVAFAGRWVSKTVSGTYIKMAQHIPGSFGRMYHLAKKTSTPKHRSPVYVLNASYAFRMHRVLEEFKPDMIVCTHVFGGQTATHLKKHDHYKGILATVMTDYTLHPYVEDVRNDLLVIPHKDVLPECRKKGFSDDMVRVIGIPVSPRCQPCYDKAEAKRLAGLDPTKKQVLIVGGSMGAGNLPKTLAELLPVLGDDAHVTVVCGSNKKAKEKAESLFADDSRVTVLGRVSPLYPLMAATDVLLTKAGGLTSTEAMTIGVPMVIMKPIPGCETSNAILLERHGMASYARKAEEIPDKIAALLRDDKARSAMIAAQRREIEPEAAEKIASMLIKQVNEKNRPV